MFRGIFIPLVNLGVLKILAYRGSPGAPEARGHRGRRGQHCALMKMPLCIYANGINI